MEAQLQSLIDKIKKDGVEEAQKESGQIIDEAKKRASGIREEAEKEAVKLVDKAKEEAARIEDAGKKALEQAGRDLILSLRGSITELFDRILEKETQEALRSDQLAGILEKMLEKWERDKAGAQEVEVLLGEDDGKKLRDSFLAKLRDEMKKGITLKPVKSIEAGFRIGEKDSGLYYDFTDAGISEMLSRYLNPVLSEIIQGKDS